MEDINIVEFYTPNESALELVSQYSMSNLSQVVMMNGCAWVADLLRNGKHVASVENHGDGGSNHYYFHDSAEEANFTLVAKTAYEGKEQFEDEEDDILCAWLDIQANYAVSA